MLTLHPKEGIELLAVEVPEDAKNFHFYRVNNESVIFKWDDVKHPLNPHDVVKVGYYRGDLALYKWPEFIATTKTITEEQAAELVEHMDSTVWRYKYKHYVGELGAVERARYSLKTLIWAAGGDPDKKVYAILKKD